MDDKEAGALPPDLFDLQTAEASQREAVEHFKSLHSQFGNPWKRPPNPREQGTLEEEPLEKRYDTGTPAGRNRAATREFVRASLARGKTIASLSAHARTGGNQALASEIEEIGRELGL